MDAPRLGMATDAAHCAEPPEGIAMANKGWAAFPHPNKAFDYAGDKLAKAWKQLHAGDLEAFPDERHIAALLKNNPKLGKDAAAIATQLQDAWRAFHRGDFHHAYEQGVALKALGASVAIKAGGIHATYLLDGEKAKMARYEELIALADAAVAALPDEANSHYRRAFAIVLRATTISHGIGSPGTCSRRRHATRNVSETTS